MNPVGEPLREATEVAPAARGPGAVLAWAGRKVMAWYAYVADLMALVYLSLRELANPVARVRRTASGVILRQILFTGVDALPVMSAIALMVGIIIITQAGTQLPKVGAGDQIGTIIVVTVIRELGPLLTMFVVVGRSGSAITTELGYMRVGQEITALELMGVQVTRFIVMPRMMGMILSMICLTLYFDTVAVLGGFVVAKFKLTVPFAAFAKAVMQSLSVRDLAVTATKGVLFGTAVAAICCHHGLSVRSSFTEVPQQTTRAMINSLKICLVLDILVTVTAYF
ncbi:MAG: ABC transporter permease [Nitrospirota bacterium]|nr:ABC transporter permease [Nitrospirota bacterium]